MGGDQRRAYPQTSGGVVWEDGEGFHWDRELRRRAHWKGTIIREYGECKIIVALGIGVQHRVRNLSIVSWRRGWGWK